MNKKEVLDFNGDEVFLLGKDKKGRYFWYDSKGDFVNVYSNHNTPERSKDYLEYYSGKDFDFNLIETSTLTEAQTNVFNTMLFSDSSHITLFNLFRKREYKC